TLLEKYQFLAPMKGLRRVSASIQVEDQIEVRIQGEAEDEVGAEEIRKQLQNLLALLQFVLKDRDTALIFADVTLSAKERQVLVSKIFEKESLLAFLRQYYQAEATPAEPPKSTPPPAAPHGG